MEKHEGTADWVNWARSLRRRARMDALPNWIPMVIFGCLILGALPVYLGDSAPSSPYSRELGFGGMQPSWGVSLYWMLGIPGGYIASAILLRMAAYRAGLKDRSLPFTVVGSALFASLLFLYSPLGLPTSQSTPGNLLVRGMLPLLVVAFSFCSLALMTHSLRFGIIAGCFVALALLVNLYNIENVIFRLGWAPTSDFQWNLSEYMGLLICGTVLLIGAAASLISRRGGAWRTR